MKSWAHPFEVKSAKEGIEYLIQGKGNYHRTLVFRVQETLEPLTFKRGVRVYLMATMGLILPPAFPCKILFNSFVHPQIFIEHLLGTMGGY